VFVDRYKGMVLLFFEEKDIEVIKNLWNKWKEYTTFLEELKFKINIKDSTLSREEIIGKITRRPNLSEFFSEAFWCLYNLKYMNNNKVCRILEGSSADTYDIVNGKYQQIKASIIENDLTSFGPRTKFDELIFLDFSYLDGSADIYKIDYEILKKTLLNKRKKETFEDQQKQGRRPRLSLKKFIKNHPYACKLLGERIKLW